MKVKVFVPDAEDSRFKSWGKVVTRVDLNQRNGYAFEGRWLRRGQLDELEVGAVVLLYDEVGSRAKHAPWVTVHEVAAPAGADETGELTKIAENHGLSWALALRDLVAAKLGQAPADPASPAAPATPTIPAPVLEVGAVIRMVVEGVERESKIVEKRGPTSYVVEVAGLEAPRFAEFAAVLVATGVAWTRLREEEK